MSWIIGSSPVYIRIILLTQNSYSLQRSHRDVTSFHFVRSSPLPKSAGLSPNVGSSLNFADFGQNKSEDKPRFNFDNKKLLEPCQIRTLIFDLHETIKCTPNSYFKLLQDFVTNIKQKGKFLYFEYFI